MVHIIHGYQSRRCGVTNCILVLNIKYFVLIAYIWKNTYKIRSEHSIHKYQSRRFGVRKRILLTNVNYFVLIVYILKNRNKKCKSQFVVFSFKKKCYFLSFAIWGDYDSTRALQSTQSSLFCYPSLKSRVKTCFNWGMRHFLPFKSA